MKWINLAGARGEKLKFKPGEGQSDGYLVIAGLTAMNPLWTRAIRELGFSAKGLYLIKYLSGTEKFGPARFKAVWPNAAWEDMPKEAFWLENKKIGLKDTEQNRAANAEILQELASSYYLGRNVEGDQVYRSPLGRFIYRDASQTKVKESPAIAPHLFLRADDDRGLDLCAEGMVQAASRGEVLRSEDLARFIEAAFESELQQPLDKAVTSEFEEIPSQKARKLELIDRAQTAIDAAALRRLVGQFDTVQDAFGQSIRLYERLPIYAGTPRKDGTVPLPLNLIAQRLLGDTKELKVLYPNAFDGQGFAFLGAGTEIHAYRGTKNLARYAEQANTYGANVHWGEQFQASSGRGEIYDALYFNADSRRSPEGARLDYQDALLAMSHVRPGGRGVFLLSASGSAASGELCQQTEQFLQSLTRRYELEELFEVSNELLRPAGNPSNLRVLVARNVQKPGQIIPELIPVLHGWDAIKERVDETLARAKVKEATSQKTELTAAAIVQDDENLQQARYTAFSKVGEARTMIPRNLQEPFMAALSDVEEVYGPIDTFVEQQIGFGENTLGERFSPEQIDAIGLSLSKILDGRANILADETGIGKGRVLAGLATWASKQGRPVVFITDKANLFSDLARDLRDIGEWGRFNPLVMNADGAITVRDGDQLIQLAQPMNPELMKTMFANNAPIGEVANIVFTTYSQLAGEDSEKASWLENQLGEALLIVDEAHVASGADSNIAAVIDRLVRAAWGVQYSSATWAKSHNNIEIYSRALPQSVNVKSLVAAMKSAGETFSEIFAYMLCRDGGLTRREHDLSKLEFVVDVDTRNIKRNVQVADQVSNLMAAFTYLSGEMDEVLLRSSIANIDHLRGARHERQQLINTEIYSSNFGAGSMLYQVYRRMNASLNIEHVVDLAISTLEQDEKPVIVFEDTAESFVKEILNNADFDNEVGFDPPTIRDLFKKIINDISKVRVTEITEDEILASEADAAQLVGEHQHQDALTIDEVINGLNDQSDHEPNAGEQVANGSTAGEIVAVAVTSTAANRSQRTPKKVVTYQDVRALTADQKLRIESGLNELIQMIDALPPLPLCLADELTWRLSDAGLRVGEISGRGLTLNRIENTSKVNVVRRKKSKKLVNEAVADFNFGRTDVMLINRSGAAGLSLHSSPKFSDRRRRHLIELQIPENPTDRVQLFGRVNRYDQVSVPRITVASTGVRGEVRHLMMQNRKLCRMSATVRSNRESFALVGGVRDLMDPIGELACKHFLSENPLYAKRMGINLGRLESITSVANLFTQRAQLIPSEENTRIYDQVYATYDRMLIEHEAVSENPLKPKEMDWKADTRKEKVLFGLDLPGVGSAFDAAVKVRVVDYKEYLNPITSSKIYDMVHQARMGLIEANYASQSGSVLNQRRTPIVSMEAYLAPITKAFDNLVLLTLVGTHLRTVDEALAATGNILEDGVLRVRKAHARALWLKTNLPKMVPGAIFAERSGSAQVQGVIVSVAPPPKGHEMELGRWNFNIVFPFDKEAQRRNLADILKDIVLLDNKPVTSSVIGGDYLLSQHSGTLSLLFDQQRKGWVDRSSTLLVGNMYLASEWASQTKTGSSCLYTDSGGRKHRAVLLNERFSFDLSRFMPVRLWAPLMVRPFFRALLNEEVNAENLVSVKYGRNKQVFRCHAIHTSFKASMAEIAKPLSSQAQVDKLLYFPPQGELRCPRISVILKHEQAKRLASQLKALQSSMSKNTLGDTAEVTIGLARRSKGADIQEVFIEFRSSRHDDLLDAELEVARFTDEVAELSDISLQTRWSAKLSRTMDMLDKTMGLQIYANPSTPVGKLASKCLNEFFIEQAIEFSRKNPKKLAIIQDYIARENSMESSTQDEGPDLSDFLEGLDRSAGGLHPDAQPNPPADAERSIEDGLESGREHVVAAEFV